MDQPQPVLTVSRNRYDACNLHEIVEHEIVVHGYLYMGTSPMRNSAPLGPYSRTMPRALWRSSEVGLFLMSEFPL